MKLSTESLTYMSDHEIKNTPLYKQMRKLATIETKTINAEMEIKTAQIFIQTGEKELIQEAVQRLFETSKILKEIKDITNPNY